MARKVWLLFDPFEPEEPRVRFTEPSDDYEYCFADMDEQCEHGVRVDWQEALIELIVTKFEPSPCQCKGFYKCPQCLRRSTFS